MARQDVRSGGTGAASRKARVSRRDGLALRRALSDRLLPALVAAMTFLAALALAGAVGASLLASRWSDGAAAVLTVQVPNGDEPVLPPDGPPVGAMETSPGGRSRIDSVMALLSGEPSLIGVERLDRQALARLLAPWLGNAGTTALPLPAVIRLRLRRGLPPPADLAARLDRVAPGTLLERNGVWSDRLVVLTQSLQACAGLALLVVAGVAIAVVAAATRASLAARRQAIEIVHGLGATDGYIAGRFAGRATRLAVVGGAAGTLLSVPLLVTLCHLAAPFATMPSPETAPGFATGSAPGLSVPELLARVPLPLWIALPLLPMTAALIGWGTAQATVRAWLRQLP